MSSTIELIRSLTSGLTGPVVSGLIDKDISLWWDCATPEIRAGIKHSLNGNAFVLALIPDNIIIQHINQARPDLVPVLATPKGVSWLVNLIRTLRVELVS